MRCSLKRNGNIEVSRVPPFQIVVELTPSSKWKWPEISGLDRFEGRKMHSARWDSDYDFRDKTVAVIGAGSSAIQIVPSLQPSKALMAIERRFLTASQLSRR